MGIGSNRVSEIGLAADNVLRKFERDVNTLAELLKSYIDFDFHLELDQRRFRVVGPLDRFADLTACIDVIKSHGTLSFDMFTRIRMRPQP